MSHGVRWGVARFKCTRRSGEDRAHQFYIDRAFLSNFRIRTAGYETTNMAHGTTSSSTRSDRLLVRRIYQSRVCVSSSPIPRRHTYQGATFATVILIWTRAVCFQSWIAPRDIDVINCAAVHASNACSAVAQSHSRSGFRSITILVEKNALDMSVTPRKRLL